MTGCRERVQLNRDEESDQDEKGLRRALREEVWARQLPPYCQVTALWTECGTEFPRRFFPWENKNRWWNSCFALLARPCRQSCQAVQCTRVDNKDGYEPHIPIAKLVFFGLAPSYSPNIGDWEPGAGSQMMTEQWVWTPIKLTGSNNCTLNSLRWSIKQTETEASEVISDLFCFGVQAEWIKGNLVFIS